MGIRLISCWLLLAVGLYLPTAPAQAQSSCPDVFTQWTHAGTVFCTKKEALADMHIGSGVPLTQETPSAMGANYVQYEYTAPPQPIALGTWQYVNPSTGTGEPYLSSEAEAVPLMEQWATQGYGACALGVSATPTSDWVSTDPPPWGSLEDYRYYTVEFTLSSDPNCSNSGGTIDIYTALSRLRTYSCPTYYGSTPVAPYCQDPDFDYITKWSLNVCPYCPSQTPSTQVGNPCDVASREKLQSEADYSGPGISLTRYYHSSTLESSHNLGIGWTHNYAASLVLYSGQPWGLERPDGHQDALAYIGGEYISESGAGIHVVGSGSNWVASLADGSQEVYSGENGSLLQLISPAGQVTALNYNSDATLASVVGPFGHTLQFTYNAGLLTQVTDPAGGNIQYAYDANNNLSSVTYPGSVTRAYEYENSAFPNHLTGITDESGVRYATFGYDSYGRAISSTHSGGADAVSIAYDVNSGSPNATVTDGLGGVRVFTFTDPALTGFSPRVQSLSYNGLTSSYVIPDPSVDAQQRATQTTDANGNVTTYVYDTDHLTSKTEADGTSVARTTNYAYLAAATALPTTLTEARRQTSYSYYSGTNNVETKTVTDTTVSPNVSRTWIYTYDSYGRVLTAQGPRTDLTSTTTYTYYTCTTGAQCGQLHTVTDPAGHITTYNTYNAHGQPLTITDPNGVVTTLAYDARERLTSRQVGSETTSFSFYPTGLLQTVTLPDASTLTYTYDGAHRLTQITDGAGNSMHYTLDAMGNRTAESAYDASSTLDRTLSRVYNTLNELYQIVGAAGTSAVTTTFGYDSNGNQTAISAPLSRNTATAFDALNRRSQVTDPNGGNAYFVYDASDDLTSVKDPRAKFTTYAYTGFSDLKTQVSPDTGTTTYTYDSGGNLATGHDARGNTTTYSYDAANRLTQAAYGDQTIAYSYDAGTNGKTRLTGASDTKHSMSWQYDTLGRTTGMSQTVAGITKSVSYSYTSGDLTSLTTPSGQSVTYGYTNHQISSISINGTTLLSGVLYEAFGPVRGWQWGNTTNETRLYNTDGNPSQMAGVESHSYTLDNAFRITGITNASNSALSWTYGYDVLDRLNSASQGATSLGWTYDANGNRLTQSASISTSYTISTSNNRLTSSSGAQSRTYTYDADSNILTYGTNTFTYNKRDRMATAKVGSVTTSYVYNALGQRIEKSGGPAGTVLYWYDQAGHLLGEYSSTGALIQETVYLGDIPVATIRLVGSTPTVYYVHADHLNTPIMVTKPSTNAIAWRWDQDPFGTISPNQNPAGLGTFVYNLRFPGQYYDQETGLNYNYMRDYDPTTGRYVESDPIGLYGRSFSTYTYARNTPISNVDPKGKEVEVVVPVAIVGYACYELYCIKKGIGGCAKKYPNHTDPLSSDYAAFAQCQKAVVTICASMGAFGQDPLGSAASEAGGRASGSNGEQ